MSCMRLLRKKDLCLSVKGDEDMKDKKANEKEILDKVKKWE